MYDKNDAINGKEMNVFKFGAEYGIQELIDACCSFFKESVDASNVCDYIQFAYENNLEELKQKCLQFLKDKKNKIDPEKLEVLQKNVLLDLILFGK